MADRTQTAISASLQAHRRQFVWQILLPMILVTLLVLAAGVMVFLSSFSGQGTPRLWADVALIWLLAPMLLFALGLAFVLIALIYALARLFKVLPEYTGRVQQVSFAALAWVNRLSDALVRPVLWIQQVGAAIGLFGKRSK
jgi:hypothetical protein